MAKLLKSLKETNWLSLAVIVLFIFIPLYPKFPLVNVPGTYVAIRVEDLLVMAIVLFWLALEIKNGFPVLRDRVSQLILLYLAIGGLSFFSALLITKNISSHLALLHWFRRFEYMSLFFVAYASVKEMRNVVSYAWAILLATIGVVIYGLGQKFFAWPVVSTMNEEFSKGLLLQLSEWARVNSTFAGHYDLAAYLVMILALTIGLMVGLKKKASKVAVGLVGFFSLYLLVLTASRVSFIAYLMAMVLILISLKKYWWVGPVLAVSLMLVFLSADFVQRYATTFNIDLSALSTRIKLFEQAKEEAIIQTPVTEEEPKGTVAQRPKPSPKAKKEAEEATVTAEAWKPTTEMAVEYSSGIRFNVEWPRSLRAFAKNPLLGTGYSSVTLATDNDYLRILAETGLLGFLSFWLIFLEIGRRVILFFQKEKKTFAKAMVVALAGAAIGLFANAIFIDVFEASKVAFVFWLLMGTLMGLMALKPVKLKT
ncbi:MAG TPA: O-antigen ligase family protein [Patescibacteria group bacterium]|nr:O-antigen ligase family protein [Patescibacteria group bacterium]